MNSETFPKALSNTCGLATSVLAPILSTAAAPYTANST